MNKREFLLAAGAVGAAASVPVVMADERQRGDDATLELQPITGDAKPIMASERKDRIANAVRLMQAHDLDAVVIEAGSALDYFTGIRWWRSERFTGLVLAASGDWCIVTPFFEGPSIREQMAFGDDVRTWHEDENPFELVAGFIRQQVGGDARIGIEETTRYFVADGLSASAPNMRLKSANVVTRGCRMFKSAAELALMQSANDVTMAAYRHVYPRVRAGMSPTDIAKMMNAATRALGGEPSFALVLLGTASAYPHGTDQPQRVQDGEVVLMDCGCSVHGYESDISRTWVHGKASTRQRKVWDTVKQGQLLALETIASGVAAGEVDSVVRAFYVEQGFGPDYDTPGLTHRLGHGIGMDGHEPINFVRGEQTPLSPGMCFSNEPGLYLPGEFGVRLEDCLYVGEEGPVLFSKLSASIDRPFG